MGWRGYSVLVNYQSLVSILFPLAPLQLFFSIKYKWSKLLRMSFIKLLDFMLMIYQHPNKKTKILSLTTSHIGHLYNQLNHVCTANFYAVF